MRHEGLQSEDKKYSIIQYSWYDQIPKQCSRNEEASFAQICMEVPLDL